MTRDEIAQDLSDKEMSAIRRRERATKAAHAFSEGIVGDAFREVRGDMLEKIANSPMEADINGLRRSLYALDLVQEKLKKWATDGKLAEKDLEHIRLQRQQLGIFDKIKPFRRTA